VASEAETLALPPDPAQRATEILAPHDRPQPRWPARRLAAGAALVVAAIAGLVLAIALTSGGGGSSRPPATRHGVAPPAAGTNVAQLAQNIVTWLKNHTH
jgi:ferric-dicitrate binding protein FerR (iron transport regulator)